MKEMTLKMNENEKDYRIENIEKQLEDIIKKLDILLDESSPSNDATYFGRRFWYLVKSDDFNRYLSTHLDKWHNERVIKLIKTLVPISTILGSAIGATIATIISHFL